MKPALVFYICFGLVNISAFRRTKLPIFKCMFQLPEQSWLPLSAFKRLEHLVLWGFFSVKKGNKQRTGTIFRIDTEEIM